MAEVSERLRFRSDQIKDFLQKHGHAWLHPTLAEARGALAGGALGLVLSLGGIGLMEEAASQPRKEISANNPRPETDRSDIYWRNAGLVLAGTIVSAAVGHRVGHASDQSKNMQLPLSPHEKPINFRLWE